MFSLTMLQALQRVLAELAQPSAGAVISSADLGVLQRLKQSLMMYFVAQEQLSIERQQLHSLLRQALEAAPKDPTGEEAGHVAALRNLQRTLQGLGL